jgi:hypothetical protein
MRKIYALMMGSVLFASSMMAQEVKEYEVLTNKKIVSNSNVDTVAWMYDGTFSIGFNQGLLHNWQAGGELASLTANGIFYGSLTRYNRKHLWTNNLDMGYGLLYTYSNNFVPRKTDDRIDLTSKYGYRLSNSGNLYFTALFNAKTQFTRAYNYDMPQWDTFSTSRFLSPLYMTLAPGIEYRKGSDVSLFFSPLASRFTYVHDYYTTQNDEGAFGVAHGKTTRFELGAYFTGRYKKALSENISYNTRLDLYSNYLAKDKELNGVVVKKDNPGNIDIMWDNFLSFKFYKYFSLNFGVLAIYDNDVPYYSSYANANRDKVDKNEPFKGLGWWQVKQFMSIGFNYKF